MAIESYFSTQTVLVIAVVMFLLITSIMGFYFLVTKRCPDCHGNGKIIIDQMWFGGCCRCNGTGRIRKEEAKKK